MRNSQIFLLGFHGQESNPCVWHCGVWPGGIEGWVGMAEKAGGMDQERKEGVLGTACAWFGGWNVPPSAEQMNSIFIRREQLEDVLGWQLGWHWGDVAVDGANTDLYMFREHTCMAGHCVRHQQHPSLFPAIFHAQINVCTWHHGREQPFYASSFAVFSPW